MSHENGGAEPREGTCQDSGEYNSQTRDAFPGIETTSIGSANYRARKGPFRQELSFEVT
jgi:hypothetical protein